MMMTTDDRHQRHVLNRLKKTEITINNKSRRRRNKVEFSNIRRKKNDKEYNQNKQENYTIHCMIRIPLVFLSV